MKALRSPIAQTRRDAWTEVNLGSIEHNLNHIKKVVNPGAKIMAVVKADAYGHGAAMVAKTLAASGVSMFAVAAVDEGIQLRMGDIKNAILILGPTPGWAMTSAVESDLEITVFTDMHLKDCIETARKLQKQVCIHIKIDTGMHRIGVPYKEALKLIEAAQQAKEVNLMGVFSHLACAEDPDATAIQISRWNEIIEQLKNPPPYLHFTNSAALMGYKNIHYNLVRTGLELYGLQPDLPPGVAPLPIKQAMALRARITHLHTAEKGEGVSYGHRYNVAEDEIKIATIPVGYADGVSRRLSGQISGVLNHKLVPQIATITMDQMMFDVTALEKVSLGDMITILGEDAGYFLSIDDWAAKLGTINYEVPCLLKVRLPRVYTS